MLKIRDPLYYTFHTHLTPLSKVINGVIAFLLMLSVSCIPVYLFNLAGLLLEYRDTVDLIEKVTVTILFFEYVLKLYSAHKIHEYIRSSQGIFDVLSLLPFFFEKFHPFFAIEFYVLFRLIRILKLASMGTMDKTILVQEWEKSSHQKHFNLVNGESIVNVVQKHPLVFLLDVGLPLMLSSVSLITILISRANLFGIFIGILFGVLAATLFAKEWLDMMYDVVYITDQRIVIQNKQLFGMIYSDIPYESMASIIPNNTGFWRWLFDFGNIEIQSTGTGTSIITDISDPKSVADEITRFRQKSLEKLRERPKRLPHLEG